LASRLYLASTKAVPELPYFENPSRILTVVQKTEMFQQLLQEVLRLQKIRAEGWKLSMCTPCAQQTSKDFKVGSQVFQSAKLTPMAWKGTTQRPSGNPPCKENLGAGHGVEGQNPKTCSIGQVVLGTTCPLRLSFV